jgi:hypothetical protein
MVPSLGAKHSRQFGRSISLNAASANYFLSRVRDAENKSLSLCL